MYNEECTSDDRPQSINVDNASRCPRVQHLAALKGSFDRGNVSQKKTFAHVCETMYYEYRIDNCKLDLQSLLDGM